MQTSSKTSLLNKKNIVLAFLSVNILGCATLNKPPIVPLPTLTTYPSIKGTESSSVPPTPSLPNNPEFIKTRAQQAYKTGRLDTAENYYLQLSRIQPKQASPWFKLGNLYAEQGRLDAAEHAYRQAMRRHDSARTLHNLGLVQIKLGIGALREAQQRLPANDPVHQQTHKFLQTLLETWRQQPSTDPR